MKRAGIKTKKSKVDRESLNPITDTNVKHTGTRVRSPNLNKLKIIPKKME
jgi:hypothetical protein